MRRVNKNENFKKEDFEEGFNRVTQKCKITPTEDEDVGQPLKIGLIHTSKFLPFKDFTIPREDYIYLNYN